MYRQFNTQGLSDEQARVSNLRSGEVDAGPVTADVVVTLEGEEGLEVQSGLYAAPRVIQMTTTQDVPWRDKRVRQAISKVVDRNLIISNVYAGEAELTGPIPPGYGEYPLTPDQLAELYAVDLEGARALMEEAGLADGFSVELQAISAPRDYADRRDCPGKLRSAQYRCNCPAAGDWPVCRECGQRKLRVVLDWPWHAGRPGALRDRLPERDEPERDLVWQRWGGVIACAGRASTAALAER